MAQNSIFLGVTTSPAREMVAELLLHHKPERIHFPCAGRFAAVEAFIKSGGLPTQIYTSDIGLFSSLLGYLADPTKAFDDLGLVLPPDLPPVPGTTPLDLASQAMLALKLAQVKNTHQYGMNFRRELLENWTVYHQQIKEKTEAMVAALKGIRYDLRDVWEVVKEAANDPKAALYVNVPAYSGGYVKMFQGSGVSWQEPQIAEYNPDQFPEMLALLTGAACTAVVYVQGGVQDLPGEGWQTVFAKPVTIERNDYLITNRPAKRSFAALKIPPAEVKLLPIYNDETILPTSTITFKKVNLDTALYYRDLFVHKLGSTKAETHLLMLIDGRVVTALGLNTLFLRKFQSDYVYEVFGISKSSIRYARLGKLFMLALTSGDFKQFVIKELNLGIHEPRGIQTTSITTHTEGKTDRSVMKIASRELLKDGRYKIIYRADFRTDTWSQCVAGWLKKWGAISRKKDEPVAVAPALVTTGEEAAHG